MTDRVRSLTVILERDIRDDDIESTVQAIKHIRNVADVQTGIVRATDVLARMTVRAELRRKIHAAVEELFEDGD
jgi:hypothetical protein